MTTTNILVADDHEVVRQGLRTLLEAQEGWHVCAEAVTGRQAVEAAQKIQPDVVVMDISMPELNGLEATRQIRKTVPQAEVLILTMHDSEQLVREVLQAGARGFVLKADAGSDLVAAVEALRQHRPFFTSKVSAILLEGYLKKPTRTEDDHFQSGSLTAREREIVQLIAEGKSNKEVARTLNISVKTVETHRNRIMRKLDLRSVTDLVRYAIRNQLVQV